ncbi:MAG: hypothetical protein E7298_07725 [Lachnospiraceae bacterium]|nr:hypothetical protein [Lachnospiraceae bacterium]
MKIAGSYNSYELNNTESTSSKPKTEKEYANYLMKKYPCLSPGKNSVVSVTSGLLRKAMSDDKTGEWLERELSKAPDYIKQAQQSAIAHGSTLKFCSIEFGEEYTTMTVCGMTDGGGTDPDIDEWLEKVKKKRAERKAEEKKREEERTEARRQESEIYKMELKGRDLENLTRQFAMNLPIQASMFSNSSIDMKV